MVFNAAAYLFLIFAASIVLGSILFLALKRALRNRQGLRILIGLVTFVISWVILYNTGTDVVVVHRRSETHFVLIGTDQLSVDGKLFKLKQEVNEGIEFEGKVLVPASMSNYSKFIINRSGNPLVFETLHYGNPSLPPLEWGDINLFETDKVMGVSDFPDYFPSETPPQSISVRAGVEYDREHWLRFAKGKEISKAKMQKTIQHLREAGGPLDALLPAN